MGIMDLLHSITDLKIKHADLRRADIEEDKLHAETTRLQAEAQAKKVLTSAEVWRIQQETALQQEELALKRYEHEIDRYILGQQLRIVNQAMREGADITFRDVRISNRPRPEQAAIPAAPFTLQASIPIVQALVEENRSLPLNKKKWLLGYVDEQPKIGTLYDLRSCGFGGSQGQGKTSTMAYHAYQAAANGCKLIVIDPHGNLEEGLLPRLAPIRSAFFGDPVIDEEKEVGERCQWINNQLIARKRPGGMDEAPTVIVLIDELNVLMRMMEGSRRSLLIGTMLNLAQEGRKMGIFLFAAAQTWQGTSIGGANIRQSFPSRIVHRMESGQMKLMLDCSDDELQRITTPALRPGQAVIATANGDLFRLTKPLATIDDGHTLARIAEHRPITGQLIAESPIPLRIASPAPASDKHTPQPAEAPAARQHAAFDLAETAAFRQFRAGEMKVEREAAIPPEAIDVPPALRARIKAEAEKQKAKYDGRVFRTKIRDALNLDNDKGYRMVKAVCDQEGYWFATPPDYTEEDWEALKARYDYRCLRCKRQEPEIELTADHVDPKGPRGIENIQPLCRSCNSSKGAQHIDYRKAKEGITWDCLGTRPKQPGENQPDHGSGS